jgi:hypothetical protein
MKTYMILAKPVGGGEKHEVVHKDELSEEELDAEIQAAKDNPYIESFRLIEYETLRYFGEGWEQVF